MRPLIGITAQRREVNTTYGTEPANTVVLTYSSAVAEAGGIPVLLPILNPEAVPGLIERLNGVVLTGGGDVDPSHYRLLEHSTVYGVDAARDEFELALARQIAETKLPVLAICRGLQVLNVALGGTLIVDIPTQVDGGFDHFRAGEDAKRAHQALRLEESCHLAGLFGTSELKVNSLHHQAVAEVAPGLHPVAWSEDGVIEAMEPDDDRWEMRGVQWHPEHLVDSESAARALFEGLVRAASEGIS